MKKHTGLQQKAMTLQCELDLATTMKNALGVKAAASFMCKHNWSLEAALYHLVHKKGA